MTKSEDANAMKAFNFFSTPVKMRGIIANYLFYKFWEGSVNITNQRQKHLLGNVLELFVDCSMFGNRLTMFYSDLPSKIY